MPKVRLLNDPLDGAGATATDDNALATLVGVLLKVRPQCSLVD